MFFIICKGLLMKQSKSTTLKGGSLTMRCYQHRYPEAVVQRFSVKKVLLEISQNWQEKTCTRVFFVNKVAGQAFNFNKKETLAQVFSCEFSKIPWKTFLHRTPLVAASGYTKRNKVISSIAYSIHGHLSYILEAKPKRPFRKKEKR